LAKHHSLAILLSDIPNPFLQDRVDSPWQETFQDVSEINRTAFQSIQKSVEAVSKGNQSRGLVLHGEPGSGKTHILQRLRFYTQKEPRTWFIYVPPFPGPSRFWRHLLECFFYDICQRSKQEDRIGDEGSEETEEGGGPGQGPLTQIEEALTRHLMNRPLSSTEELARWWTRICEQDSPGEALFKKLKATFGRLAVQFRLDPEVMKVLRHYLTWHHRSEAYAYLLGRDLPDDELTLLGTKQSLDDETRAREAVITFCRLTGPVFTIILAFDQLEGLQVTVEDLDGLRAFANHAVDLMGQCSNVLVLSAVQTYFLDTLKKSMHVAHYHRLAQDESILTLLSRGNAKRLVEFRLATQKELIDWQKENPGGGPLWPFEPEEIEARIPAGGLSARELIRWARQRFDELKTDLKVAPPPPADLDHYWDELLEKELDRPAVRLDEGVYEDGLLKILQVKPPRGYRIYRGKERDLHVVMEGGTQKVGISVSNSENMTSLAKQLGRLQELSEKKRFTRLIFLRDARLPISPTAEVTQQRLKDLARKGTRILRPPAEVYAALNALRKLWNKAAENDLVIGDSAVSMGELRNWLAEKTPRPLQEILENCQETAPSLPDDLMDKLVETLTGQWVIPLKDAADALDLSEEGLSQFVVANPEVAGFLAGPPPVVFLRPEAVSRY
jgi:hypothetical protein